MELARCTQFRDAVGVPKDTRLEAGGWRLDRDWRLGGPRLRYLYANSRDSRLRHPLVGGGRRGEGAAPLVLTGGLRASSLQGRGRRTNGRGVIAVDRERVVRLGLSTRALLLVVLVVGVHGVGLGQRGRHQERTDHV